MIPVTSGRERARAVAALRVAFGLIWAVDAFLKWQPDFRRNLGETIAAAGHGQPAVLQPWFSLWGHLVAGRGQALSLMTALVETALAVGLLAGFARRLTYAAGLAYALVVWSVAEGFGGPYALGTSTDVGAALIYAVLFAALLLLEAGQGAGDWSVDRVLLRRLAWWHHLAAWGGRRVVRPWPQDGGAGRVTGAIGPSAAGGSGLALGIRSPEGLGKGER